MFEKLRTAIETAPEKVSSTTNQLVSNVRHRAHVARGEGHSRIWETQTRTLERGVELLSKGKEMPVMKLVVPHAEKLVQSRLDQVTELPIDAFEGMNAKAAARSVRGLGWVELLRVKRWEESGKNRKTVLDAVTREQDKLRAEPLAA